jgi:hypothetical protein
LRNWSVKICNSPLRLIASIARPLPSTAHSKGPEKIPDYANITEPHTAAYFTALLSIFQLFFKEIKGTASQESFKLYNYFCSQKNEVKKSLLLLIFKKLSTGQNYH